VSAAGSALVTGRAPADAALEASLEALERSGSTRADLALVFVSATGDIQAEAALHAVRRVTGARAVVGCTGAGVLVDRREAEEAPAVAVLVVRDERLVATPVLAENMASGADEIAARVEPTLAEGGCLLVLPDPVGLDPKVLLASLEAALGRVPVVGGVAAGDAFLELCNTRAVSGGLAALALAGPVPVIGVAQGCVPIGSPYVITRAEANVVHEIGSRPALDVLREAIESVEGGSERLRRAGLFAGLAMDPAKSPLERGDFLVRNLLGADRSTGAVAVGDAVRVGQTLQFQIRDAEASRDDLRGALEAVRAGLAGRRPAWGCYFDCAGRGRGLFGVPDHDVILIRETLGDFPLAGFFGNGELAPVGRRNFFHTYTGGPGRLSRGGLSAGARGGRAVEGRVQSA
jgi:small ligand-binding sensory domain FIST